MVSAVEVLDSGDLLVFLEFFLLQSFSSSL